jgi:hypothetical protein
MLPLVATLVMGAMSRQAATSGTPAPTNAAGAGCLLEMLGGALDQNRDGSMLDELAESSARRSVVASPNDSKKSLWR